MRDSGHGDLGARSARETGGRCLYCVFAPDTLIREGCGETDDPFHTSSCVKTTQTELQGHQRGPRTPSGRERPWPATASRLLRRRVLSSVGGERWDPAYHQMCTWQGLLRGDAQRPLPLPLRLPRLLTESCFSKSRKASKRRPGVLPSSAVKPLIRGIFLRQHILRV